MSDEPPHHLQCRACSYVLHLPWKCSACGLMCSQCCSEKCWDEHNAVVCVDLHTEIQNLYHGLSNGSVDGYEQIPDEHFNLRQLGQPKSIMYCAVCIAELQLKTQIAEKPAVSKYDATHLMNHLISGEKATNSTWTAIEESSFYERMKSYPIDPTSKNKWGYFSVGLQNQGIMRTGRQCQGKYWSLVKANMITGVSEQHRQKRKRSTERDKSNQKKRMLEDAIQNEVVREHC